MLGAYMFDVGVDSLARLACVPVVSSCQVYWMPPMRSSSSSSSMLIGASLLEPGSSAFLREPLWLFSTAAVFRDCGWALGVRHLLSFPDVLVLWAFGVATPIITTFPTS